MALKDFYNTNDDNILIFGRTIKWLAQTFTAGSAYDIGSVKLLLYKTGAVDPGTVTVSIKETAGDLPTGGDLAFGTFDSDLLTENSSGEWKEITFGSPYSLTAGEVYAVVIRVTADPLGGDNIAWRCDATPPAYAGGRAAQSVNTGSLWSGLSTIDMMFETYSGVAVVNLAGTGGGIGGGSAVLEKIAMADLIGTGGGVGGGSAALSVSGMPSEGAGMSRTYKRVVVAGNDQIFYEDI